MAKRRDLDGFVFDLGGVVTPHDNDLLYTTLASRCSGTDLLAAVKAAVHDPEYGTGRKPISALHRKLLSELGYRADWDGFVADWSCHLTVDEDMLKLLDRLSQLHRVVLFSNTNQEHWEHIRRISGGGLDGYKAYLSYELGHAKPSHSSFNAVATQEGLAPARCLFVDDREENIAAAGAFGFQTHLFTTREAFEERLHAYGVLTQATWR
ncbi:MAG: HAD-superfamily hydrolase, subfamily variant 3 [Phenylobacterium sp.]|nr:HAD-superfamily hydrolase, subfamily variant 3 [Phenylobacterium sp.]